jgi:hypothetical protein
MGAVADAMRQSALLHRCEIARVRSSKGSPAAGLRTAQDWGEAPGRLIQSVYQSGNCLVLERGARLRRMSV